jgi:hypothetical protein
MAIFCIAQLLCWLVELRIQAYISGRSQGVWAILGQSEEGRAKQGTQCLPVPNADAGSIDQHGIELAVILAAGIAAVIGSSCYDSPRKRG